MAASRSRAHSSFAVAPDTVAATWRDS